MNTPAFPKIETLTDRKFTHRNYQDETASYRLSSYNERLRNYYGWPIKTGFKIAPTKDITGRNVNYASCSIEPEFLDALGGEAGKRIENPIETVKRVEDKEEGE